MHEYSIVQALLTQVEGRARTHGASRVARLHLRIGELSGVEIDLLESAFETFRERTVCAGAELTIRPVPATWSCPECGRCFERGQILRCAACERPAQLTAGDEIFLDRIEMEVAHV